MVKLSTMESELLEATTAAVLLESIGCLLDEILRFRAPRVLRVDNSSATIMLQGGAGWRTRHLKVRSSYLREHVAQGLLQVEHVEGFFQLADLGTKMHPRVRLFDLLRQWQFAGLPDQDVCAQLAKVVALHCIMTALQRLPGVDAHAQGEERVKEPLAASGVDELLMVSTIVALIAVIVWELVKWVFRCVRRSVKRESKLKRLRELARLAAEVEIDRVEAEQRLPSSEEVTEATQSALAGATERSGRAGPDTAAAEGSARVGPSMATAEEVLGQPRAATPRGSIEPQLRGSPGVHSVASSISDDLTAHLDRERLCKDVLSLLHCDALKLGLRQEGLTLSGLKPELFARLAMRMVPEPRFGVPGRNLPTDKQLRYILYLWRHKGLRTRCVLQWGDVYSTETASNWNRLWKEA